MRNFNENASFNGGSKWTLGQWFRALFTSNKVAGYRAFVAPRNLTLAELAKVKRIPYHAPNWLTSRLVSAMVGMPTQVFKYHNLIPTVARTQVAKALANQITTKAEIAINYQELGTGSTAPANGDTGLQTPTGSTRKAISSLGYSGNVLSITCFWAAGEATGTWAEMATFINGSGTSNSGTLFNRIALAVVVGGSNALTVDGTVTLT